MNLTEGKEQKTLMPSFSPLPGKAETKHQSKFETEFFIYGGIRHIANSFCKMC